VTAAGLGHDQIVALLTDLGHELTANGLRGDLFVVGGAAMAFALNTRRATRDVDAVFEPKAEVYSAARRVAARHELPDDWLNDAVKGLLPGPDPQSRPVLDVPGLRVSVPSARYLLALKVAAARVRFRGQGAQRAATSSSRVDLPTSGSPASSTTGRPGPAPRRAPRRNVAAPQGVPDRGRRDAGQASPLGAPQLATRV
jgi:hypothetical protein